jgi:hypothetical protein
VRILPTTTKERTIIAHFPSSTKAQAAVDALEAAGLADNHIRRNTRFGVSHDNVRNAAISNLAETLTGLTIYSADTPNDDNRAARVLMGADPSVSGYSARGYGLAGGSAFTLVSFVPEERVEEAVKIMESNDGTV